MISLWAARANVIQVWLTPSAQAFQATPSRHAPAVVLGILPGLAGWGTLLLKAGLRTGGLGTPADPFSSDLMAALNAADIWAAGAFALEQGQIITAMLLAALLVFAIEGRFLAALQRGGVLAWFGVINPWQFTTADTVMRLGGALARHGLWPMPWLPLCCWWPAFYLGRRTGEP